jgi:hypothetical protein
MGFRRLIERLSKWVVEDDDPGKEDVDKLMDWAGGCGHIVGVGILVMYQCTVQYCCALWVM